MKYLFNSLATLLLLPCAALASDPPAPNAGGAPVPPVLVSDIRVQTVGEERDLEDLPEGLLFLDAATGKLMVADENDPHGRAVCVCKDIDWHSFTNDLKINGHKILFNQFWSQSAEGGSLVYRFGTNAFMRLAGDRTGSFANMAVDSYDPTNGTMVVTADAAGGTLQVCTNLLEAGAWQAATNAIVTATTDASTTWSIALLGADAEFYRVLAAVALPAGIHAERTLHANAGIEMAGVTWTNFPDMPSYATTSSVASVERRVRTLETNETYYCRWAASDVSKEAVSWVPTNNWPSRSIDLQLYPATSNLFVGIRGDWEPTNNLRLAITITRSPLASGADPGGIVIGENTVIPFLTSQTRRRYELTWVSDAKVWVINDYAHTYRNFVFDSSGSNSPLILPNDVFLPEFDE